MTDPDADIVMVEALGIEIPVFSSCNAILGYFAAGCPPAKATDATGVALHTLDVGLIFLAPRLCPMVNNDVVLSIFSNKIVNFN